MSRVSEKFYSVSEAMFLLSFTCTKTILRKIKSREFGDGVINVGTDEKPDYRIPASGLNGYVERRRVFKESDEDLGISARTTGELRRKVKEATS